MVFSGYNAVCKANSITRIGCWDHARRKFVEADKGANPKAKTKKGTVSKADVALSYIRKLYRIESNIADKTDEERLKARQEISLPILNEFKQWLEKNAGKVMKGSALRKSHRLHLKSMAIPHWLLRTRRPDDQQYHGRKCHPSLRHWPQKLVVC